MEVVKNYKQLVNEHVQRSKLTPNDKPSYVCTPDREIQPNGFFCTLTVGGQTYCTPNWQKTKKGAELEAAKIACEKLNLQKINAEIKAEKAEALKREGVVSEGGKPAHNGRKAVASNGTTPVAPPVQTKPGTGGKKDICKLSSKALETKLNAENMNSKNGYF